MHWNISPQYNFKLLFSFKFFLIIKAWDLPFQGIPAQIWERTGCVRYPIVLSWNPTVLDKDLPGLVCQNCQILLAQEYNNSELRLIVYVSTVATKFHILYCLHLAYFKHFLAIWITRNVDLGSRFKGVTWPY